MAWIEGRPQIGLTVNLVISEGEARALDAMAGYGTDAFVKVFYEHLGKAYMERHEHDLRNFLNTCRELLPPVLGRVDDARMAFESKTRRKL
jgi:hypothetical protein